MIDAEKRLRSPKRRKQRKVEVIVRLKKKKPTQDRGRASQLRSRFILTSDPRFGGSGIPSSEVKLPVCAPWQGRSHLLRSNGGTCPTGIRTSNTNTRPHDRRPDDTSPPKKSRKNKKTNRKNRNNQHFNSPRGIHAIPVLRIGLQERKFVVNLAL